MVKLSSSFQQFNIGDIKAGKAAWWWTWKSPTTFRSTRHKRELNKWNCFAQCEFLHFFVPYQTKKKLSLWLGEDIILSLLAKLLLLCSWRSPEANRKKIFRKRDIDEINPFVIN
jgi:hypothetical protein